MNFKSNREEEILAELKNELESYNPDGYVNSTCYSVRESILENFKKEINYREILSKSY